MLKKQRLKTTNEKCSIIVFEILIIICGKNIKKNAKYDCEKTCLEINNKIAFTVQSKTISFKPLQFVYKPITINDDPDNRALQHFVCWCLTKDNILGPLSTGFNIHEESSGHSVDICDPCHS